jgi:acetyltransferase-like isoleucine patch superfamily enzyme
MQMTDAFTSTQIHPLADVQSHQIGAGTRIWQFVVILPGARIGADCNICSQCFIENDVVVGDRVTLKNGVYLWDGVTIEDDVFLGPNATFTNDLVPRSRKAPPEFLRTRVEMGASIGAGAVILPGLIIGAGAMVGAGAVVTGDVAPGETVVGNPAKPILWRD